MMDGIILAALALLSVPVLLIVILVKVCGLENKVADLTKKVGVIDFTRRNGAAENVVSRRDEMHRSRERSGCLSEANPEGAARGGAEGIRTGGKAPSPPNRSPRLGVSARCFTRTKHQRGEAERKH